MNIPEIRWQQPTEKMSTKIIASSKVAQNNKSTAHPSGARYRKRVQPVFAFVVENQSSLIEASSAMLLRQRIPYSVGTMKKPFTGNLEMLVLRIGRKGKLIYTVNNEVSSVSADRLHVYPGDRVEWHLQSAFPSLELN